jgi:hypothetical protein
MKTTILILLLMSLASCQPYVYEDVDSDGCSEPEPYGWQPEIHRRYYDFGGTFQGECAIWYIGEGWFEKWCNWPDVCGWEFVEEHWEPEQ